MLLWIDTTAAIALSSPPSAFLRCSALKNICCDGYTQLLSPAPRGIDDVTRSVGSVDDPARLLLRLPASCWSVDRAAGVHHRAAVRLRRRRRAPSLTGQPDGCSAGVACLTGLRAGNLPVVARSSCSSPFALAPPRSAERTLFGAQRPRERALRAPRHRHPSSTPAQRPHKPARTAASLQHAENCARPPRVSANRCALMLCSPLTSRAPFSAADLFPTRT